MENLSEESQKNWYTVKVLYESIRSGNPILNKTGEEYFADDKKLFEESIILVKAITMEQAKEVAEELAKKSEHDYFNAYGELVKWQFVSILHVFELNDDELTTGTEIYSRFIYTQKENSDKEVIMCYFPEAQD